MFHARNENSKQLTSIERSKCNITYKLKNGWKMKILDTISEFHTVGLNPSVLVVYIMCKQSLSIYIIIYIYTCKYIHICIRYMGRTYFGKWFFLLGVSSFLWLQVEVEGSFLKRKKLWIEGWKTVIFPRCTKLDSSKQLNPQGLWSWSVWKIGWQTVRRLASLKAGTCFAVPTEEVGPNIGRTC